MVVEDLTIGQRNNKMKTEDILKLVKETFEEEISSSASESALGLESHIDGKEEFLKRLEEKLKMQSSKIIKITHKDKEYTLSTEDIHSGDSYWSNFHNKVLICVNEAHAKGLNLINQNKFGTNIRTDYNFKIIK